jgi:hypothetical protein
MRFDDSMFDPAAFGSTPGMLAQMLAAGGLGAPQRSSGFPEPPQMSSGDGGSMMPLPQPPVPGLPAPVDVASQPFSPSLPTAGPQGTSSGSDLTGSVQSGGSSAPSVPPSSLLGRIRELIERGDTWRENNRSTLMALGAGMAGAPSLGAGLGRGMQLALNAQQTDLANQKQNQTVKWLVEQKGVPVQEAQALVNNPEMLKQVLPRLMGARQLKWTQTGEDMLGNKQYGFVDEASGKRYDDSGREITPTPGGGGVTGAGSGLLAPGVTSIDRSLTGQAYLRQFSPEVQGAVNAYIEGRAMPTGNPRKGWTQFIKETAQRVGEETGRPVDDNLFNERRKMRTDIGASSPNSMGGIISNGKSAFEHLANLSDKYTALGNYNGPNMPGGGMAGEAANYVGNTVLSTPQARDKIKQANDNALKYGQEATKFYAGSGGGEAERMSALHNISPESSSSLQQAGFLQTEKELMLGRLTQKEAQIRDTLGQAYLDQHPVVTPELQKTLAKIDANIAKLRGQAAPSPTAPAVRTTKTGVTWSIQ